jgi:hypothetical protein
MADHYEVSLDLVELLTVFITALRSNCGVTTLMAYAFANTHHTGALRETITKVKPVMGNLKVLVSFTMVPEIPTTSVNFRMA